MDAGLSSPVEMHDTGELVDLEDETDKRRSWQPASTFKEWFLKG
jgi:hypothetical protein